MFYSDKHINVNIVPLSILNYFLSAIAALTAHIMPVFTTPHIYAIMNAKHY